MIDGHALIQVLEKPKDCNRFGEYAAVFLKLVTSYIDINVSRVDIVFGTYIKQSIKVSTRGKRGAKKSPVRKVIEHGDVPLPQVWSQFISLDENKAGFAQFLSQYLIDQSNLSNGCELVTYGGFEDPKRAESTLRGEIPQLGGNHEEADTCLILHACEAVTSGYNRILVVCKDTDVLLLLTYFLGGQQNLQV